LYTDQLANFKQTSETFIGFDIIVLRSVEKTVGYVQTTESHRILAEVSRPIGSQGDPMLVVITETVFLINQAAIEKATNLDDIQALNMDALFVSYRHGPKTNKFEIFFGATDNSTSYSISTKHGEKHVLLYMNRINLSKTHNNVIIENYFTKIKIDVADKLKETRNAINKYTDRVEYVKQCIHDLEFEIAQIRSEIPSLTQKFEDDKLLTMNSLALCLGEFNNNKDTFVEDFVNGDLIQKLHKIGNVLEANGLKSEMISMLQSNTARAMEIQQKLNQLIMNLTSLQNQTYNIKMGNAKGPSGSGNMPPPAPPMHAHTGTNSSAPPVVAVPLDQQYSMKNVATAVAATYSMM
jgi:hypothetical protein